MTSPLLALDALRYRWPGAAADTLDIAALTLAPGERLLLRGGSGCGKSTLLQLAAGVLLPDAGAVRLLGQDWCALRAGARDQRRVDHVGYLFQQFNLLPYLSVRDNVLLPCRFSARRAQRACAEHGTPRAAAEALLAALDLDAALWSRPASTLSVGQQQRVAAARALIGQPELVIADEPTSALDEDRRDAFMALLLAQCARHGIGLVFVSHDARLARHFERVVDLPTLNRAGQTAPASA
jgi:putative ABC transport system ATP-binding protein